MYNNYITDFVVAYCCFLVLQFTIVSLADMHNMHGEYIIIFYHSGEYIPVHHIMCVCRFICPPKGNIF